jgi:hypothetical protein
MQQSSKFLSQHAGKQVAGFDATYHGGHAR